MLPLLSSILVGCYTLGPVVGPDYSPPEIDMQDAWHQAIKSELADDGANLQTWWHVFNDQVLNGLIERANRDNLGLKEAFARIKEAHALSGIAIGERFPDNDVVGQGQEQRTSHMISPSSQQKSRSDQLFQLKGIASWEFDFWGRITRSIESTKAIHAASIEDYRDVLVVLFADVASSYIDVRTFQERINYIRGNIEAQRKSLKLTEDRFNAGLAPELDVRQAELNLARTESTLPTLEMSLVHAINRLGVLLGDLPDTLHDELLSVSFIPKAPKHITARLPIELLQNRPDIRQAERALAAQTALIGVATADLYPRISLFGAFGMEALEFNDLFEQSRSRIHNYGPSFTWNIFDGGRVRNRIRAEDARAEEAYAHYRQTVLDALEDVENSLVSYKQEDIRREKLERSVFAARRSVELVTNLYMAGLTNFQDVQDMELLLFEQEDQYAHSEGMVILHLISIYRSLGGGWEPAAHKRLNK